MTPPDDPAQRRQRDAALLAQVASGDRGAFESLHRAHHRAVIRLAMGVVGDADEARDVAQEVFVRLLQVAGAWAPNANVATWLRRTTLNVALTWRRRVRRWWSRSMATRPEPDPERTVALQGVARDLDDCLSALSPRQRAAVTLHLDQGLTPAEVAESLNISANAARLALSKGLRALRTRAGSVVREVADEGA